MMRWIMRTRKVVVRTMMVVVRSVMVVVVRSVMVVVRSMVLVRMMMAEGSACTIVSHVFLHALRSSFCLIMYENIDQVFFWFEL